MHYQTKVINREKVNKIFSSKNGQNCIFRTFWMIGLRNQFFFKCMRLPSIFWRNYDSNCDYFWRFSTNFLDHCFRPNFDNFWLHPMFWNWNSATVYQVGIHVEIYTRYNSTMQQEELIRRFSTKARKGFP